MLPEYVTSTLPVQDIAVTSQGLVHKGNSKWFCKESARQMQNCLYWCYTVSYINSKNDVSLIIEKEWTCVDTSKSGFMTSNILMLVMWIIKF